MPKFKYTARDSSGRRVQRSMEAATREEVAGSLRREGLVVRGLVTDSMGAPIAGAEVSAEYEHAVAGAHFEFSYRTRTGPDGIYRINGPAIEVADESSAAWRRAAAKIAGLSMARSGAFSVMLSRATPHQSRTSKRSSSRPSMRPSTAR